MRAGGSVAAQRQGVRNRFAEVTREHNISQIL
jgi:hypothetical protein